MNYIYPLSPSKGGQKLVVKLRSCGHLAVTSTNMTLCGLAYQEKAGVFSHGVKVTHRAAPGHALCHQCKTERARLSSTLTLEETQMIRGYWLLPKEQQREIVARLKEIQPPPILDR